jgi:hypothetical protein
MWRDPVKDPPTENCQLILTASTTCGTVRDVIQECFYIADQNVYTDGYNVIKTVKAWMPLPEPFTEEF